MDYEALKRMPANERKDTLEGLMLSVEETHYTKPLTAEEIAEQRINLTAALVEKALIEDSFRIEKEKHKLKIAPIAAAAKTALDAVRVGAVSATGKVYKIPNYDEKTVSLVDEFGNFLQSRPMLPTERQLTISHNNVREERFSSSIATESKAS
jgi:hypothetical protein